MPTYCYTCEGCKKRFEVVAQMEDSDKKRKCSDCGRIANRDLLTEQRGGVLDSQMHEYNMEGSTGCRPYAASYLLNQKEKAHQVHPGTDFKEVNGCYMPVIKHKTHYKKYLKEMNFVEF